jgi:chemotaxis protein methyltransferase CheR
MKNMLALSENELNLFQKLLVEEAGLHFVKETSSTLQFALYERMQKCGYASYQEYYDFLKSYPNGQREMNNLFDLITVGETYFFRNRPHFDALMDFVLPEIVERKIFSEDRAIRIWSAGCSKGAEPYSIAIAIMETIPAFKSWNISILGTDINRDMLFAAKEAVYQQQHIEHLPKEYLDKYFKKKDDKFILDEEVKKLVRFEYHNLAKDPFTLEGMNNLDIIFCRNVTIYFDFQITKRIIDSFYNCLVDEYGYLFIGHSETLWQISNEFQIVEFPQTFIYKKARYAVAEKAQVPFMGVPEIGLEAFVFPKKTDESQPVEKPHPVPESERKDELEPLYKEATRLFNEKRYSEAITLFDEILDKDKNHIRAHFVKANILANQGQYKDAISELSKIIEVDNLYVEAYYLFGVLAYKISDFKEAETQFRKVIYVDPKIALAYFNLGNIYLCQQQFSNAHREFSNAIKLLKAQPKDAQVQFSEDFTVEILLRACRNSLKKIQEKR